MPPPGRERGAALIEVLVAVVIMGIAFVIIVGGIGTAIIGSDLQQQRAGIDVALRSAADHLAFEACPASGEPDYQAQLTGLVADGVSLSVATVSYWNPGTDVFDPGPSCLDTGLHLVELQATSTSGRSAAPETLQVVKRRP